MFVIHLVSLIVWQLNAMNIEAVSTRDRVAAPTFWSPGVNSKGGKLADGIVLSAPVFKSGVVCSLSKVVPLSMLET